MATAVGISHSSAFLCHIHLFEFCPILSEYSISSVCPFGGCANGVNTVSSGAAVEPGPRHQKTWPSPFFNALTIAPCVLKARNLKGGQRSRLIYTWPLGPRSYGHIQLHISLINGKCQTVSHFGPKSPNTVCWPRTREIFNWTAVRCGKSRENWHRDGIFSSSSVCTARPKAHALCCEATFRPIHPAFRFLPPLHSRQSHRHSREAIVRPPSSFFLHVHDDRPKAVPTRNSHFPCCAAHFFPSVPISYQPPHRHTEENGWPNTGGLCHNLEGPVLNYLTALLPHSNGTHGFAAPPRLAAFTNSPAGA